jgi:hypothetical protein
MPVRVDTSRIYALGGSFICGFTRNHFHKFDSTIICFDSEGTICKGPLILCRIVQTQV